MCRSGLNGGEGEGSGGLYPRDSRFYNFMTNEILFLCVTPHTNCAANPDWKNITDQAHSCPRVLRLSVRISIVGSQMRVHMKPLGPSQHYYIERFKRQP